jgi:hypothetical protein
MFSAPLVIREIGYERWEVVEPFRFTSETGLVVDVPIGFETDLASIPRILQSILGKISGYSQPAVVHDLLYYWHRTGVDTDVSRKWADKILREGIELKEREYDVSMDADTIYTGVRMGGLASWETPQERRERLDRGDDEYLDQ